MSDGAREDGMRGAVCELLGVAALDEFAPIAGGLGGRSYRVGAGGARFVAKWVAPSSQRTLALELEYALLGEVAARGLGPRPVAVDTARRLLVTEHVAGARPLTRADVRQPAVIERIAAALRRLHAIRFALPPFAPARFAEDYLRAAGGSEALDADERRLADELRALAARLETGLGGATLCHNDLVADNVLGGERIWLVDFEYAQAAAPILDLASLAAMNDFDEDARSALIDAYHAPGHAPFSRAEFAKVLRLVGLLGHFWVRAQPSAEAAAAARYLDRAVRDADT